MNYFTRLISEAAAKGNVGAFAGTNPVLYRSAINTPVYSDLSINGGSYNLNGINYSFDDINEPSAVFRVSHKKIIVKNYVNTRPGSIKEFITPDDFVIECGILLNGSNLLYPDAVSNFIVMLESNQSIEINSWFLQQFGITDIVIEEYDMPQAKGNLNNQGIFIKMLSDSPLILNFNV
jgi:hypothetical protein